MAETVSLLESVKAAVAKMHWLTESDHAVRDLAFAYARRIDAARGTDDETKALYLGPHLLKALEALGGSPAERKALGVEGQVRGKLAALREARQGAA